MIYKDFQNLKLSALGLGCMRLPVTGSGDSNIDKETTERMIAYAMEKGINYYDTAWGYHSGNSELVVGEILAKYPRDKFYIASKFPGYDASLWGKVEEIFEKQLEKCRVDYFDFYLFHNLNEKNVDAYLDPKYGIYDYLMAQKANGRIKHLGFSAHGDLDCMRKFLNAYGKDMEFCQIQLNYIDWTFQDAKAKVDLLNEWNIPIWVMEPVRGGQLARLPEDAATELKELRPEESAPAWAFRFIQSIPGVVMTLSGMSNEEQLVENIATFAEDKPLDSAEKEKILAIADRIINQRTVPCTGCRYCVSHCPMELEIPFLIQLYNEAKVANPDEFNNPWGIFDVPEGKKPWDCIGCRSCEAVCPQNITIPDLLAEFKH